MENIEAIIAKIIGVALMITSSLDFFEFIPLPKTSIIPPAYQLGIAFGVGLGLMVIPLSTIQGWYNKAVGKKVDKI